MIEPNRTEDGRPATPGEALRWVKEYLDITDRIVSKMAALIGRGEREPETEVQDDLDALAEWFDLNTAAADQAWAYVRENSRAGKTG